MLETVLTKAIITGAIETVIGVRTAVRLGWIRFG